MLAQNMAGGTINSHIAALGTFATWLNKPRPRSELLSYIIRGEKATAGPLPKARVHDFPIVAVLANIDAIVAQPFASMTWLSRAHVLLAMLSVVWPHRPHSLVSVRAESCYLADGRFLFVSPAREKRKTCHAAIRLQLPALWLEFVSSFLELGPKGRPWLFSLDDVEPTPALHTSVFDMFIRRFSDAHIEPYDCRRFGATAYHRAQAPLERIMHLGGWTTQSTLLRHYVEESYLLPASAAYVYSWLVDNPPLISSERV